MAEPGAQQRLRRGGRPKKAAADVRALRLPNVRLTVPERLQIDRDAAAAGMLPATYIRALVLGHKVQPAKSAADDALLMELNRIGTNLNQIARALNADRPERADLAAALDELRPILSTLAAAV